MHTAIACVCVCVFCDNGVGGTEVGVAYVSAKRTRSSVKIVPGTTFVDTGSVGWGAPRRDSFWAARWRGQQSYKWSPWVWFYA